MKKIMLFCAAVLAFAACTNDITETTGTSTQPVITFEGGFAVDTKTAFTDADAASNKLVWTKDDAIGIFTVSGATTNINYKADLLRNSVGNTNGIFIPVTPESEESPAFALPEDGTENFLIYYPYSKSIDINVDDAKIHSEIAEIQYQEAVSDKQIGKNGFSYATAQVTAETKKVNFTLTHAMTYMRFVVASNDYAEYMLSAVQLYDADGKEALSGAYTFDVTNNTVAAVEGMTKPAAKVALTEDAQFTAIGTGTQELYLTLLPGADLSASKLYAVVTFTNTNKENVTIPVAIEKKGKLEAGTMITVDLGSVNASSNAFPWYEPVEKRNMVDGWCYGAANTYFVERNVETTWNALTFEVKARGDFSQVAEPKYVGIISSGNVGNNGLVRLSDNTKTYNERPETLVSDNYEVSVIVAPMNINVGSSAWGVIAIYDKDYNLLWSYMINTYEPGEAPVALEYTAIGKSVMDRNLGAKKSAQRNSIIKADKNPAWFQWGRPTPLPWSNSNQAHYNGAYVTGDTDLKAALSKPFIKWGYTNGDGWTSNGNWYVGPFKNLWGGNKSNEYYDKNYDMGKTVYDPCPKGYRVISGDVVEFVAKNGIRNEYNHPDVTPAENVYFKDIQASVVEIPLGGDRYDYWIYSCAHWGSNSSWGNRNNDGCLYWSNSPSGEANTLNQAYLFQHCYFSSGYGGIAGDKDGKKTYTANRAMGFSIRCMVDTENR